MSRTVTAAGLRPSALPDFPWDRLASYTAVAREHPGGICDLSVGTPVDPTPAVVQAALAAAADAPGYPQTAGSPELRAAIVGWLGRRFGVRDLDPAAVLPVIGTKELVAWLPTLLGASTVGFPGLAYPTYDVGARLAGAAGRPVDALSALGPERLDLLWINSPSNPTGKVLPEAHLRKVVDWCRERGTVLASDECYADLWYDESPPPSAASSDVSADGALPPSAEHVSAVGAPPLSAEAGGPAGGPPLSPDAGGPAGGSPLAAEAGSAGGPPLSVLSPEVSRGSFDGLLAVHSLSKRSNLAGYRAGFVAGDPALVARLLEVRKHAGMIVPAPVQAAMVAALSDDAHVVEQRARYAARRATLHAAFTGAGFTIDASEGGLYLWATRGEPCYDTVSWLAQRGILVAPGDFYGPAGAQHVRVALTATDERVAAAAERLQG